MVVFAWDMLTVQAGFVIEEQPGQVSSRLVVIWVLHWVECGMMHPAQGTAAVGEGKYVREGAVMRVAPDGEFDGDDGGEKFQEIYRSSAS